MGVPQRPLDEPVDETIMTGYQSNSGQGMPLQLAD